LAVIDLTADIAYAGAVIAPHTQPTTAGLMKIAPFRLALLEVLIRIAFIPDVLDF
jgi:hypothetical protein